MRHSVGSVWFFEEMVSSSAALRLRASPSDLHLEATSITSSITSARSSSPGNNSVIYYTYTIRSMVCTNILSWSSDTLLKLSPPPPLCLLSLLLFPIGVPPLAPAVDGVMFRTRVCNRLSGYSGYSDIIRNLALLEKID